jgi:hypothetical protein
MPLLYTSDIDFSYSCASSTVSYLDYNTGTASSINYLNSYRGTNSCTGLCGEENQNNINICLDNSWSSLNRQYRAHSYEETVNLNVSGYISLDSSLSLKYTYIPTPVEVKKWEIKKQLTVIVKSRAQEISKIPSNEWMAIQTLRDMITETEYRKYLKDGFISIKGQSGKIYKISKHGWHTKVFLKGDLIEEICVRLKGDVPPTDNVIAFKTMIETDEEYFASLGNRYIMKKVA